MYPKVITTKIKNTLSALTVALGIIAFGFGVGEPAGAVPYDASVAMVAERTVTTEANAEAAAPAAAASPRRSQSLKRHLAMPFISISPLLPRRGA